MKIVINAFSAKLGGGQTYLTQLLRRIPENDIEIVLFAPPSLKLPLDPRVLRPKVSWPVDNPILRAIWERFRLPQILREYRANVLFCPGGVVATKVPRGCATVTMFRNMIPFTPAIIDSMPWSMQKARNLILKRVMLRSMVRADLTIFISQFAKSVIERLGPIRNGITIPHGIGPEFRNFHQNMKKPAGFPNKPYFLYVSRFDFYKHHREVVAAYADLPPEMRDLFALVLIGENNSPEADFVAQMITANGLSKHVHIMGSVPYSELPAWYFYAKLTIFASSCENCPNILLESLGAGRPVLSSDVMPMPEFGGDDILYFSPNAPKTLTKALLSVLESACLEQRLARSAKAASRRYDWELTAQKTWSALRAVVAA